MGGGAAQAQGEINARQHEFGADVSDQNARYAEISAAEERSVARSQAAEVNTAAARAKARQRAAAGSSGFTVEKGFKTLQHDIDRSAYKAKTRIYKEGARREHEALIDSWESKVRSQGLRYAANNARAKGRLDRRAAIFGGLAGGVTRAAGLWG